VRLRIVWPCAVGRNRASVAYGVVAASARRCLAAVSCCAVGRMCPSAQGPRRARLRGAPLPYSHNAQRTGGWWPPPVYVPPQEGQVRARKRTPTTPRAYPCFFFGFLEGAFTIGRAKQCGFFCLFLAFGCLLCQRRPDARWARWVRSRLKAQPLLREQYCNIYDGVGVGSLRRGGLGGSALVRRLRCC
jgi:hypothetical protein